MFNYWTSEPHKKSFQKRLRNLQHKMSYPWILSRFSIMVTLELLMGHVICDFVS